jgi:hypothetical protein
MAPKEKPPPWPFFDLGDGLVNERLPDQLDEGFNDNVAASQGVDDDPQISQIACAFGHEDLLSTVVNMADWGASHLRSASESAWRGDVELLGDHLRQASSAIKAAQMTLDVIEAEKVKAAADAEATAA